MAKPIDTYATRNFKFRDEKGKDHEIAKGTDLAKREPKIPEGQIEDFRHIGWVGEKPDDEKADAAPAPAASTKAA